MYASCLSVILFCLFFFSFCSFFFFFTATAPTEIYTLSLHDALPILVSLKSFVKPTTHPAFTRFNVFLRDRFVCQYCHAHDTLKDRKSTRLNSSHRCISYAVFCLKKKKK